MEQLLTTKQVCALYGYTRQRLWELRVARKVEPTSIVGRAHLWDSAAAAALKPKAKGRPKGRHLCKRCASFAMAGILTADRQGCVKIVPVQSAAASH